MDLGQPWFLGATLMGLCTFQVSNFLWNSRSGTFCFWLLQNWRKFLLTMTAFVNSSQKVLVLRQEMIGISKHVHISFIVFYYFEFSEIKRSISFLSGNGCFLRFVVLLNLQLNLLLHPFVLLLIWIIRTYSFLLMLISRLPYLIYTLLL